MFVFITNRYPVHMSPIIKEIICITVANVPQSVHRNNVSITSYYVQHCVEYKIPWDVMQCLL
jgi:hypothetical protein